MIGKKLNYDYPPRVHSNDDLRYAEDIIVREGRIEEWKDGELLTRLDYPNLQVVGTLDISNDVLLFCQSSIEIGGVLDVSYPIIYYNRERNTLKEIIGPNSVDLKLSYNTNAFISAVYKTNTKSEIEVVFTDGVNKPYFINIGQRENPTLAEYQTSINDIYLFPEDLAVVKLNGYGEDGGSLAEGVYYMTYRFFYEDGTYGTFNGFSEPIIINNGERLMIEVSQDIPTNFDGIEIYVMYNGEVQRIYQNTITELNFIISIAELNGVTVSIDDLSVNGVIYDRVGALGVIDNSLILGDVELTNYNNTNLQGYVNNFYVTLNTELVDVTDDSKYRTFRPGEVYALYAQPQYISGEFGKAYHIPAKVIGSNDDFTFPIPYELDESYPISGDFPDSNVLHHRIPDELECYQTAVDPTNNFNFPSGFQAEDYGNRFNYIFGLTLNIPPNSIPAEISGDIKQWRLLYAKKTIGNSRVIDDCQATFQADATNRQSVTEGLDSPTTSRLTQGTCSLGGNFQTNVQDFKVMEYDYNADDPQASGYLDYNTWSGKFILNPKIVRLHSAEILLNQYVLPSGFDIRFGIMSGVIATKQVTYVDDQKPIPDPHPEDSTWIENTPNDPSFVDYRFIDYYKHGYLGTAQEAIVHTVDEHEYIISGTTSSGNNQVGENALLVTLDSAVDIDWIIGGTLNSITTGGMTNPTIVGEPDNIDTDYMCKAWIINDNRLHHAYFWDDELVPTSACGKEAVLSTKLGSDGDTFLGQYTEFYSGPFHPKRLNNTGRVGVTNDSESGYLLDCGVKIYRRMVHYSRLNLNGRTQDTAESTFKGEFENNDGALYEFLRIRDTRNSQTILIDAGFSKLNTYESVDVHHDDIFDDETTEYPFRLHSSTKNNWRDFPVLQTQDVGVSHGKVLRIENWGDKTIIHQERGLYITRDKVSIKTDDVSAYVGTTDFLSAEPQQIMPRTMDVALRDKRDAIITKLGYFFVGYTGNVYHLTDKIVEISALSVRYLFRDDLKQSESDTLRLGYDDEEERILLTVATNVQPEVKGELVELSIDDINIGDLVSNNGIVLKRI